MWIALITWDGGSNRQPFETVDEALIRRGAQVEVLSHEAHRQVCEAMGASFTPLPVGEKAPGSRPSLETLRDLGAPIGQGFYLWRSAPPDVVLDAL